MYKNILVNCDTDSIMISKPDGAPWTKDEQEKFLNELNRQFPEKIVFEHDGFYSSVVVVRSKNYALLPEGEDKIKLKGSSIKDQKKEPALREMMERMIKALVYHKLEELPGIYKEYVKEAMNVTDIKRWSQKKTISRAVLDCEGYTDQDIKDKKLRRNETVIWDAIVNEEDKQEGNKIYLYPVILGNKVISGRVGKNGKPLKDKVEEVTGLRLSKYWKHDEDKLKLVERCFATVSIFQSILDMSQFLDYSKKTNADLLKELL